MGASPCAEVPAGFTPCGRARNRAASHKYRAAHPGVQDRAYTRAYQAEVRAHTARRAAHRGLDAVERTAVIHVGAAAIEAWQAAQRADGGPGASCARSQCRDTRRRAPMRTARLARSDARVVQAAFGCVTTMIQQGARGRARLASVRLGRARGQTIGVSYDHRGTGRAEGVAVRGLRETDPHGRASQRVGAEVLRSRPLSAGARQSGLACRLPPARRLLVPRRQRELYDPEKRHARAQAMTPAQLTRRRANAQRRYYRARRVDLLARPLANATTPQRGGRTTSPPARRSKITKIKQIKPNRLNGLRLFERVVGLCAGRRNERRPRLDQPRASEMPEYSRRGRR